MKQRFFVLVRCEPGQAYKVGRALLEKEDSIIAEVNSISGEWDLLLRFEFDNNKDFGKALAGVLQNVSAIIKTHSIIGYPIWDEKDIQF